MAVIAPSLEHTGLCLAARLADWLADWLTGWLTGWLVLHIMWWKSWAVQSDLISELNPTEHQNTTAMILTWRNNFVCLQKGQFTQNYTQKHGEIRLWWWFWFEFGQTGDVWGCGILYGDLKGLFPLCWLLLWGKTVYSNSAVILITTLPQYAKVEVLLFIYSF